MTEQDMINFDKHCLYHCQHADRISKLEKRSEHTDSKFESINNRLSVVLGSIIIMLLGLSANLILLLSTTSGG